MSTSDNIYVRRIVDTATISRALFAVSMVRYSLVTVEVVHKHYRDRFVAALNRHLSKNGLAAEDAQTTGLEGTTYTKPHILQTQHGYIELQ